MAKNLEFNMGIKINSDIVTKQLEKATKAATRLNKELEKLNSINITINYIEVEKKWWQFWK